MDLTIEQRIYNLERRAGVPQAGSCGLYLGSGLSCGKPAGHDGKHCDPKDPEFAPWGSDWEAKK